MRAAGGRSRRPERPARSRPARRAPRQAARTTRASTRRIVHEEVVAVPPTLPSRHGGFTGRAAILAVAVMSVLLALALPTKVYISQRNEIGRLESQTRAQQARVAALKAQQARWNDPAYVERQARQRLHYVRPGETAYVVLGGQSAASSTTATARAGGVSGAAAASTPGSWYAALWRSVTDAGRSGVK